MAANPPPRFTGVIAVMPSWVLVASSLVVLSLLSTELLAGVVVPVADVVVPETELPVIVAEDPLVVRPVVVCPVCVAVELKRLALTWEVAPDLFSELLVEFAFSPDPRFHTSTTASAFGPFVIVDDAEAAVPVLAPSGDVVEVLDSALMVVPLFKPTSPSDAVSTTLVWLEDEEEAEEDELADAKLLDDELLAEEMFAEESLDDIESLVTELLDC